jgi:hypothetical protein
LAFVPCSIIQPTPCNCSEGDFVANLIVSYLEELFKLLNSSSREESFYPALMSLFAKKGLSVLQLPAKTKAGFPDIKVFHKDGFITGYVECKKPEEDIENGLVKIQKEPFKDLELEEAIKNTEKDMKEGKYIVETAEEHFKRLGI